MKLRNIFSIILCIILITGCGGEVKEENIESTEATTQAPREENYTASKGGTLRIPMKKPLTLNPLKNRDVTVDNTLKLIFEPLFNIDNNMDIVPNIAESMTIKGNTITIRVKDNIYWSDGKAIGADDVVYSLSVIKDNPEGIYSYVLYNVSDFEQTGDKTLNIYYEYPVGAAGYNMAFPIIPKHYYRNNSDADMKPVGCGSYTFSEYHLVDKMVLNATKGLNGEPYISTIEAVIMPDNETMISAFEGGMVDVLNLNAEDMGKVKSSLVENSTLYTTNRFEYIGFNTRREIFKTADLRQAMVYLMPIDNVIKGIYINHITKSLTPINPDSIHSKTAGVDTYENNASTANTLILASGLTKGDFSFKILVNSENTPRVETARMLSDAFNDYGMNTQVEAVTFEEYTKRLEEGSFDMYLGGTELTSNMNLAYLLGGEGSINFTGYKDEKMDSYISVVNASMDFNSYERALNELNKYISYELPIAGIGFKKNVIVCSKNVKGEITPIFNNYFYGINKWFIVK